VEFEVSRNGIFELSEKFCDQNWNVRKKTCAEIIGAVAGNVELSREAAFAISEKIELGRISKNSTDFKNLLYWSLKTLGGMVRSVEAKHMLFSTIRDGEVSDKYREIAMNELLNFDYDEEFRNEAIALLSDQNWKIRQLAARLLETFPAEGISNYLIADFYSFTNDDVIYWVLQIIARQLGEGSLKFFESILFSSTTNTKLYVILALSEIATDGAFKLIVDCFDDPSYMIRTQVHQIIDKNITQCAKFVHSFAFSTDFRTRCEAFKFLVKSMDPQYYGMITQMVTSGSTENKILGLMSLGETYDISIIDFIYNRFSDESWYVRNFAATIMGRHGRAVRRYLKEKYIAEKNANNRYWIIVCLKSVINVDNGEDIADLFDLFNASKKGEKLQILNIIGFSWSKITGSDARSAVINALIKSLNDPKWLVRKEASALLEKFGRDAIKQNLKKFDSLSADQAFWLKSIIA